MTDGNLYILLIFHNFINYMEQGNRNKETNVKTAIDAVTELVKAVPVYQDALQPAAKQIGNSLETLTKTINIALAPIKALVWGYDKIEEFITTRITEKLKNIPEENITTPPPQVAGPAIEALRFAGHDETLRELYANLLATAMNKETIHQAHPGFVEILKNMTSDEGILLQSFTAIHYPLIDVHITAKDGVGFTIFRSNYSHFHKNTKLIRPDLVPSYLDNLCRLGIMEIHATTWINTPNTYEPLETDKEFEIIKQAIEVIMQRKLSFQRKIVRLTSFGNLFVQNVVREKIKVQPSPTPPSPHHTA